jgi:hypothetical protein
MRPHINILSLFAVLSLKMHHVLRQVILIFVRWSRSMNTVVSRRFSLGLTLPLLFACGGGGTTEPIGSSVELSPDVVLLVGVESTVAIQASVTEGLPVEWTSTDPSVATVDGGGLVTAVAPGTTWVTARSGGAYATVQVKVWVPPEVTEYEPGVSYFGRRQYVEYVPGELPLVISVPHGGALKPIEIPDRTMGTLVTDALTVETAHAMRDALVQRTGKAPHLIISHLKRIKLEPNREVAFGAEGNPYAENAWNEFQGYIESAEDQVVHDFGSGLYLDLHAHAHEVARLELGYLLNASALNLSDAELNAGGYADLSSIRALAATSPLPFSHVLRGNQSFGALLGAQGIPSLPSPADPRPGTDKYFSGGYNTNRHGSRHGGTVSGIQIELHYRGIRDTDENRRSFGTGLAAAVEGYMVAHWGFFTVLPK